jgi:hypothetical protein
MAQLQIYQQQDFTGGLNFRADQFQLADNESPKMLNVEIDPRGGIFSRGGYERINTTAVGGTWAPWQLHWFTGATPRLMLVNSTKVLHSTGGNFTTLQSAVGVDVTVSGDDGACLVNWGDKLYIGAGQDAANGYRWQTTDTYATALTALSTTNWSNNYNSPTGNVFPKCEHLCVHANKMFAANLTISGTNYPNRVHWSHEDQPEDWAETDYVEIAAGGTGIRGMAVVAGALVIFKPQAIFVLYGYDSGDFRLAQLSSKLGAVSHRGMAVADTGVYFFSNPEGLFFFDGSRLIDVFDPIRPAVDTGQLNTAAPSAITLSWVNKKLWMSAPYDPETTVTTPKVNFVFDPSIGRAGAWTMFQSSDGYGLISGCDYTDSSETNLYYMIHPNQPRVLRVDKYTVDVDNITGTTANFTSYYKTKWFDGGSFMQKKMFRRPDFVVKEPSVQSAINVKVYHDYEDGTGNERRAYDLTVTPPAAGLVWGTDLWGDEWGSGLSTSAVVTGKNLGLARAVQIQLTGPAGQSWGINSIGYKYQGRRIKG